MGPKGTKGEPGVSVHGEKGDKGEPGLPGTSGPGNFYESIKHLHRCIIKIIFNRSSENLISIFIFN